MSRRERLRNAFLRACPSATRLFSKDLEAGIEAVLIEDAALVNANTDVTVTNFIKRLAQDHGLTFKELVSPSRTPRHVEARKKVVIELRKEGFSWPEIGRLLERDHTTVLRYLHPAARRAA